MTHRFKLLISLLGLFFAAGLTNASEKVFTTQTWAMGTIITDQIKAESKEKADYCHALLNEETRRLENLLSAYIADSDVSRLAKRNGQWIEVSPETYELLEKSNEMSVLSDGHYDPTVGTLVKLWSVDQDTHRIPSDSEIQEALKNVSYKKIEIKTLDGKYFAKLGLNQSITFGAIGKGYIADKVESLLISKGCKNNLLSFGGNIIANGTNASNQAWKIGLQTPARERGYFFAILPLENASIVTSGDYEKFFIQDGKKYHHLLNPKTGNPVRATLSSVTIYDKNSAKADALCTALFVMGWQKAINFLKEHPEIKAVLMDEDHRKIAYTKNLEGKLEVVDEQLKVLKIE